MAGNQRKNVKTIRSESDIEKTYIYIGPSIRGVIQHASIYCGTKSDVIKKLGAQIKAYPEIATLIVEDVELAGARAKLKEGGNALSIAYKALIKN